MDKITDLKEKNRIANEKYAEEKRQKVIQMESYLYFIDDVRMIKKKLGRRYWYCFSTPCGECDLGTKSSSCPYMEWRGKPFNWFTPKSIDVAANLKKGYKSPRGAQDYYDKALELGYITQEEYDRMTKDWKENKRESET